MKKILFIICMLSLSMSVSAQLVKRIANNAEKTDSISKVATDEKKDGAPGSLAIYYAGKFEKAATVGMTLRFRPIELGGTYQVSGGNMWTINLGAFADYKVANGVYIEGAAGLMYGHSSFEYRVEDGKEAYTIGTGKHQQTYYRTKYKTVKESDSAFGMYVEPRLFLVNKKGTGIFIGYHFGFEEFKFDNLDKRGVITLGVVI